MTALGKLFRTTAFKLTLVYLVVFALFAAFLLGYFAWNTRRLVTEQIVADGRRRDHAAWPSSIERGGIRRLVCVIEHARARGRARASISSPRLPARRSPAMSAALPPGLLDKPGWTETDYRRLDETGRRRASRAGARLPAARAASACWSAATSRSASGSTASSSRRGALVGRASSSCSAWPAASSSRAACCGASTP